MNDELLTALRSSGEAGDLLCLHAAKEIERLRSHVELLEASSKASHSAIMLLDSAVKNMAAEIERLRLTDAEREAIGVAIQCVEAARVQRHPEEEDARGLLWRTTCGLRSLLDRTDRT
jgi:hypothetical protein